MKLNKQRMEIEMTNILSRLAFAAAASSLALGIAAVPVNFDASKASFTISRAFANQGADDPAGHVRKSQGADDKAGDDRGGGKNGGKGRGGHDDGANHQ